MDGATRVMQDALMKKDVDAVVDVSSKSMMKHGWCALH